MTAVVVIAAVGIIILTVISWYHHIMQNVEVVVEEMIGVGPEDSVPKLEQVRVLKEIGVRIIPEEQERQILMEFSYDENEYVASHPYYGFLIMEGSRGNLDCVYSTGDWECIYQEDSYGRILEKLKQISGLPIQAIEGKNRYEVSFSMYGRSYTWKARKNRDWMDCGIGGFLNRILDRQKTAGEKRFYLDNSHEAPVYLFGTETMAEELNVRGGMRFHLAQAKHEREGRRV